MLTTKSLNLSGKLRVLCGREVLGVSDFVSLRSCKSKCSLLFSSSVAGVSVASAAGAVKTSDSCRVGVFSSLRYCFM